MLGGGFREAAQLGTDVVVHHVGAQQAQRRERTGARRHQNAPYAELLGDRGRMHGTSTAERQQREGGEIDPALGGKNAHLIRHAHVDDALDAGRGRDRVHPQRTGDVGLERCARGRKVEGLRAAEKIVGIKVAGHEVGVGHRRAQSAASIAGGAGIGASALRADVEKPAAVEPSDRAAAGGDRGHIEGGHVDLPARDDGFGDFERRAALDEGDASSRGR